VAEVFAAMFWRDWS